jgi:hypothetical protein
MLYQYISIFSLIKAHCLIASPLHPLKGTLNIPRRHSTHLEPSSYHLRRNELDLSDSRRESDNLLTRIERLRRLLLLRLSAFRINST